LPGPPVRYLESANARTDVNAGGIRKLRSNFQLGLLHREIRSGERQLDESPGFLQFFFLEPVQRLEIFHFAGDAAIECRRIKMRNRADAALAREQVAPDFFGSNAATAHQAYAGDNNAPI
jgi:hypothetical protein